MNKTAFIVETCTLHGKTKQRRWHRVHTGPNKEECLGYIEQVIADLPSGPGRHWGLSQERARGFYRVRGVRVAA
jgi:hypothetical protein